MNKNSALSDQLDFQLQGMTILHANVVITTVKFIIASVGLSLYTHLAFSCKSFKGLRKILSVCI